MQVERVEVEVEVYNTVRIGTPVTLAGVEVIINMRDSIVAMQRQFSEILDALVAEMRQKLPR